MNELRRGRFMQVDGTTWKVTRLQGEEIYLDRDDTGERKVIALKAWQTGCSVATGGKLSRSTG